MANSEAGFEGVLKVGGVEHRQVRDVNLDMTATEIDDTTRDDDGWASSRQGLKKWGATWQQVVKSGDAIHTTLLNAFKNRTVIAVSVKSGTSAREVTGNVEVTKYSMSQPLDDKITVDVAVVGKGKPSTIA